MGQHGDSRHGSHSRFVQQTELGSELHVTWRSGSEHGKHVG